MSTDELLASLFDGQSHPLAASMAEWLSSSRRFTAFVNTFHTKIRKKLRSAQGMESLHHLRLELETAYLLLRERSLGLVYEPEHPRAGRSPDFAVSFTTSLVFMVEVTRFRTTGPGSSPAGQGQALPAPPSGDRFSDMLCGKLGQLLPGRGNLLLVGMEAPCPAHPELHAAMLRLQQRAEGNDPGVVERHGFLGRADFFRRYQRLSALILREDPLQAGEPVVLWVNPQAKHPLPARVLTALSRSHML